MCDIKELTEKLNDVKKYAEDESYMDKKWNSYDFRACLLNVTMFFATLYGIYVMDWFDYDALMGLMYIAEMFLVWFFVISYDLKTTYDSVRKECKIRATKVNSMLTELRKEYVK